jgi:hypothetical protein
LYLIGFQCLILAPNRQEDSCDSDDEYDQLQHLDRAAENGLISRILICHGSSFGFGFLLIFNLIALIRSMQ